MFLKVWTASGKSCSLLYKKTLIISALNIRYEFVALLVLPVPIEFILTAVSSVMILYTTITSSKKVAPYKSSNNQVELTSLKEIEAKDGDFYVNGVYVGMLTSVCLDIYIFLFISI